jgi:alkanesulfonate monooxygenase SsuD/methylene tetrahydromethanopterin reductase-like flavin-dependent oxidoreductase (luciferase family)
MGGMNFLFFHLMPYTDLPSDFREKHRGVWVDIDPALFDASRAQQMYNDFIDELVFAAESGFDAVCVNEHHSNGYGLMPSPNLIASILARQTRNVAICVLGNSIALYNPPTRVAEELAMIDVISGGRLIAGFPVGTPMDTAYAYGQNPSMLRQRYAEAQELIIRSWTEPKAFAFDGRFTKQRYVNPWPRPLQKPHPPIWIPGGSSAETWTTCAERDFVYTQLSYFGAVSGRKSMAGFWRAIDEAGKDRNPYRAGFLQFVGIGESRDHAMDLYREPAEYFYGRCLHLDPRFSSPPGYMTEASQRIGLQSQVAKASGTTATFGNTITTMETIVEKGYVVVGSSNEVAEQLREIAVGLNIGHLLLLLHFGSMSKELTRYNTEMFAQGVIPKLRGLFPEWEDKWWPQQATKRCR